MNKVSFLLLAIFTFGMSYSQTIGPFECLLEEPAGMAKTSSLYYFLYPDSVKATILYCADSAQNNLLPNYFGELPGKIEDFFVRTSHGRFKLNIVQTLKRDATHAFRGTVRGIPDPPPDDMYLCLSSFIRNILTQADSLYDFGQLDNDGPDGIANSGDDDGNVDFLIFWLLNNSGKGVAGLVDLDNSFQTRDTSFGPGHSYKGLIMIQKGEQYAVSLRMDLRDVVFGLKDWLAGTMHELGHSLCDFPDMEHLGLGDYDHSALGSFDVMSNGGCWYMNNHPLFGWIKQWVAGFNAVPSLYNPWFQAERGWVTSRGISADSLNIVLTDFNETGQLYDFSPTPTPPEAIPGARLFFTYHRANPLNYWTSNWPISSDTGAILVWRVTQSDVNLYDAYDYGDRRRLPISVASAHGQWIWNDTVNTGVPDPLTGLDSLRIRKVSGDKWSWSPYRWHASKGVGSRSCFFIPNSGQAFAFHTNPNSNFNRDNLAEGYGTSVTSGFSMRNLTYSGGVPRVDFRVNDYSIGSDAVIRKGTWYIKNSIVVQSGATLTIDPGTTLRFDPGKSLTVYGRLQAVGTTSSQIVFTSSSTSTKWGGILVSGAGANNSTIKHAIIERVETYGGSALSVIGATGFLLDSCYVRNNTTYSTLGVVFTNAGSPEVRGNRIHGNGGYGVKYSNTSGFLYADSIVSNSGGGVKCSNGSNVLFGKIGFPAYNGNSRISGGSYGVYAEANSNPTIGTQSSSYYGYNSITGTSVARVYAANSGVLAERNWWGANPPQASWFQTSNGAIDWNPYLTSDPFGTSLMPSPVPDPDAKAPTSLAMTPAEVDPLSEVRDARLRGDYSEALSLLSKIQLASSDERLSLRFVGELLAIGHFQFNPLLINMAEKAVEVMGQGTWEELTLARILEIGGMSQRAEEIFKRLSSDAKDAETQKEAALALFFSCFQTQRFNEADGILSDRSTKWGEDEAGAYGRWLMSIVSGGELNKPAFLRGSVNEEAPGEMELASYPNPFNPSTTIRFSLPQASRVNLTVFNTLGEKVVTLVDEEKVAGVHNVRFDASSIASGVYLYRLIAGDYVLTRKVIVLK